MPFAALAYAAMQGRRRRDAAAFANPALMPNVVTARPGWRRHLPALLLLVALAALIVAAARPQRTVAAPQRAATVMLVMDTSGSMRAKDVEPDRLTAAAQVGHARSSTSCPARTASASSRSRTSPSRTPRRAPTTRRPRTRSSAWWPTAAPRWATRSRAACAPRACRCRAPTARARASCPPRSSCSPTARTTSGSLDPLEVAATRRAACTSRSSRSRSAPTRA